MHISNFPSKIKYFGIFMYYLFIFVCEYHVPLAKKKFITWFHNIGFFKKNWQDEWNIITIMKIIQNTSILGVFRSSFFFKLNVFLCGQWYSYYHKMCPYTSSDFTKFWVNSLISVNGIYWGYNEFNSPLNKN